MSAINHSARTQVRIRQNELFPGPTVMLPEICLCIRMALNGASDPLPDKSIKDTYQLLKDVLATWRVDPNNVESMRMDEAVYSLVQATVWYMEKNASRILSEEGA